MAFSTFFLRLILVNWYVLEKTDSSFMVGLIASLPILVSPLAAPIGGKMADKYPRKLVLFFSRIGNGSAFILMALVVNLNITPIYLIGILSIILGFFGGIEGPSGRNMIVDILGRNKIAQGNAWAEFANGVVNALVPALSAILLTIFTVNQMFWSLPILGYLSAILLIYLIYFLPSQKKIEDPSSDSSLKDSLNYAFKDKKLRPILILGTSTMIWGITQPLIPVYCRDILGLDGTGYSLVTSANFVGAIIGSFVLIAIGSKLATGKIMSFCMTIFSLTIFLFFLSSDPFIAGFLLFFSNIFITVWIASVFTTLQSFSEEKYMGRVVSFFIMMFGLIGVGFIIGGLLGDTIGITLTVAISSFLIILLNILVIALSKSYREMKI